MYMCSADIEKSFGRVHKKVFEWAMRSKGIPRKIFTSVMGLYEGVKTRIRVDSELSEEFEVKEGMHQGSVLSPFLHWWVILSQNLPESVR